MTKFTDVLRKLKDEHAVINVYKPGIGFVLGQVDKLDDDLVTIKPSANEAEFVLHVSNVVFERD